MKRALFVLAVVAACFGLVRADVTPRPGSTLRTAPMQFVYPPPSTLNNGLIHYWPVDETSGTRFDFVGSNDLSEFFSVGYTTGIHNNAAVFAGGGEELYSTTPALKDLSSWTVALWAALPPFTVGGEVLFQEWNNGDTKYRATIFRTGAPPDVFFAYAHTVSGVPTTLTATRTYVSDGSFALYLIWFDGTKLHLQINNGVVGDSASTATGLYNGQNIIEFGQMYPSGKLDEPLVWSRPLNSAERSELFGGGAGKFPPF